MTGRVRALVAAAWAFRYGVEREAKERFLRIAERLAELDPESPVIRLAQEAALDEAAHALLCAELAHAFGGKVEERASWAPGEIAPAGLTERQALLYEVVAACCVTETESVATVTSLLKRASPSVAATMQRIASDEVSHSQLGWAHLAREGEVMDVSFLGPHLPAMLSAAASGSAAQVNSEEERAQLEEHGVLPADRKTALFLETMEEVVLPGLVVMGVPDGAARRWLEQARAAPVART